MVDEFKVVHVQFHILNFIKKFVLRLDVLNRNEMTLSIQRLQLAWGPVAYETAVDQNSNVITKRFSLVHSMGG